MKRVAFRTLGCKLNQFESDSLATQFSAAGYRLVSMREAADAYIINTCTVTGKADRKSRNLIYQARRQRQRYLSQYGRDALVIVTGCLAEQHKDDIGAYDNTYVIGNKKKHAIFHIVDAHLRGEILDQETIPDDVFAFQPSKPHYHIRGTLKIQDGCDNYCTFCIIPLVRGRAVSRPYDDIVRDMCAYVAMGYKEVVLTGVNISRYNYEGQRFSTLLEALLEVEGDFRLRISSLEPDQLDARFFALLEHPKMTPHLHLCLQSGSERVLLQMRRQYTAAHYQHIVDTIRMQNPYFNITTDIIVGFPSESASDFAHSCRMVERNTFGHVHIFPYAIRRGTRAARMDGQHTPHTLALRAKKLAMVAHTSKLRYRRTLRALPHLMLTEKEVVRGGVRYLQGYSQYYVPMQIRAYQQQKELARNALYPVSVWRISSAEEPMLYARLSPQTRSWADCAPR